MEEDSDRLVGEENDDQEGKNQKESKRTFFRRMLSRKYWFNLFFIKLSTRKGEETLSMRKSVAIELLLYSSHWCSAWGDRMWSFAVSLLLVAIYPESLLLPALYGLAMQLSVVLLATLVGDLVDRYSRLSVVFWSLFVQNCLVALCSVVLALAFNFEEVSVCGGNPLYFALTVVGVIILGSAGNLATLGNTISIEKDWVVAIADSNKSALAVLNANMRRIDLCCKLLAPTLTGVILSTTSNFVCTLFVAGWNVVFFFVEFGLIYLVYRALPHLKIKERRKGKSAEEKGEENSGVEGGESEARVEPVDGEDEEQNTPEEDGLKEHSPTSQRLSSDAGDVVIVRPPGRLAVCRRRAWIVARRAVTPVVTLVDGWRIYRRQSVALAGVSMACLYLTVLGFSGVTSAYFQTQRVNQALIGLSQGIGAIVGITGTFCFQPIRERIGTVRAGLVGITAQLVVLTLFTLPSVFLPGYDIPAREGSYFAPYCPAPHLNLSNASTAFVGGGEMMRQQPLTSIPAPSISTVHVALMLTGVLGSRFGLWMFDLAISQLVQENVPEKERGVFSGVMNVFISFMDMMHYALVVIAPRPEYFRWLALVSIAMVALGYLLYALYVRKVRGHFFHCRKVCGKCCCCHDNVVSYRHLPTAVGEVRSVRNMAATEDPEEEFL